MGYSLNCSGSPIQGLLTILWSQLIFLLNRTPFQAADLLHIPLPKAPLSSSSPSTCLRLQVLLVSFPQPWQPSVASPVYEILWSNLHFIVHCLLLLPFELGLHFSQFDKSSLRTRTPVLLSSLIPFFAPNSIQHVLAAQKTVVFVNLDLTLCLNLYVLLLNFNPNLF